MTAARKDGNPAWTDLASRDERPTVQQQTIGAVFNILRKHQAHLQGDVSEKIGENKKDHRNSLRHHEKSYEKSPVNSPQFHRNMHHMQGDIS